MRTAIFILLLLYFTPGTSFAADQQLVAPGGLANVEGNSSLSDPFNSQSFRFQQVFDASLFAGVGNATARIDRIYFRNDGGSANRVLLFFGGSSVALSTTQRAPDGLSTVFADNRGSDETSVYSGGVTFGTFYQPGISPQPFKETIDLTTPFFYIPSQGNLLLDVRGRSGQAFLPGALDNESVLGDSVSSVWATSELLTSGTADTGGLVALMDYSVVPEPATYFIFTSGLVLLLVSSRKRRRSHFLTIKNSR